MEQPRPSHLRQQEADRRGGHGGAPHQGHHPVTVHGTVHLPVGGQQDPGSGQAGLAHRAASPLRAPRHKQRPPPAVAVLEGAVLVVGKVVLGAHVTGTAPEAEEAGTAAPPRREERASDTEERLGRERRGRGERGEREGREKGERKGRERGERRERERGEREGREREETGERGRVERRGGEFMGKGGK